MFYHALTGNGSSPVEDLEPVLLWTNPDISSTFAAQTVSLNLAEYAGVMIEFNQSYNDAQICTRVYATKNDTYEKFGGGSNTASDTNNGANGRHFLVTDSGITFWDSSSNNGSLIPTKIYGVKKYVVEAIDNLQDFMQNNLLGIYFTVETGTVDLTIEPSECYVCDCTYNGMGNTGFKIKKGENFNYSTTYSGTTVNVTGTWSGNSLTVTRSSNAGRTFVLFLK